MTSVPLAIIAGRGELPEKIINSCQESKRPFVVLAIQDQTDPGLVKDVTHQWMKFGEMEGPLSFLKAHGVQDLVFAGGLTRPSLRSLTLDKTAAKWLAKIGLKAFGDDGLLSGILDLLEKEGFSVVGVQSILKGLQVPEGVLGDINPTETDLVDINRGAKVLKKMGSLDIGQGVVVEEGVVLAVEAAEGTDAMLKRSKSLKRHKQAGVLVKLAKPDQSHYVDLPTIGPETIKQVKKLGLNGIAIQSKATLIVEKSKVIKMVDEAGLFLIALNKKQIDGGKIL